MVQPKIRESDLTHCIETLNAVSKGTYRINGAYGGVQLVYCYPESGAITTLTGFETKRNLYDILWGILNYLRLEEKTNPMTKAPYKTYKCEGCGKYEREDKFFGPPHQLDKYCEDCWKDITDNSCQSCSIGRPCHDGKECPIDEP